MEILGGIFWFIGFLAFMAIIILGYCINRGERVEQSLKYLKICCAVMVICSVPVFVYAIGSNDSTSTPQATPTPSPTATATPTLTPTPTPMPTPTPVPTPTPTPIPTPEPTPIITPEPIQEQPAAKSSRTVYVGATGNKYHKQGCGTLKGKGHAISLDEALAEGRTPCKRCNP